MKKLPYQYWQSAYAETIIPSYYQMYWVQRCLELLDSDTSYLAGLIPINSASLIEEIVKTPLRKNSRTFRYLLGELDSRLEYDLAIQQLVGQLEISELIEFIRTEQPLEEEDKAIFKHVHTLLSEDFAKWLSTHEIVLMDILCNQRYPSEETLEHVTQSWLFELLMRQNYAPMYLNQVITNVFLENNRIEFCERLSILFQKLHVDRRLFTVFMRIQARKELRSVGQINKIVFSTDCKKALDLVTQAHSNQRISSKEAEEANNYFFDGKLSNRLMFATATAHAEDIGNATRLALRQLDEAIKQARFEFERSSFSIDNKVYAYDHKHQNLEKFTRRQAQMEQYIAHGQAKRFTSIKTRVDRLRYITESNNEESTIIPVIDLAFQWHRHAVESVPAEVRFMNHWIELEQFMKTARTHGLTSISSTADAIVQSLSNCLAVLEPIQLLSDLWGDLTRCGLLLPKPYISHHDGRIRYTRNFLGRQQPKEENSYRYWKKQQIDLKVIDDSGKFKKGYRIPSGFIVFSENDVRVEANESWIAGPDLTGAFEFPEMKNLFGKKSPGLSNVLYLVRHWRHLIGPYLNFSNFELETISNLKREQVLDMELAEQFLRDLYYARFTKDNYEVWSLLEPDELDKKLENLGWKEGVGWRANLRDISERIKALRNDSLRLIDNLKKVGWQLVQNENTPDRVRFELFRGQSPDYDVLENIVLNCRDTIMLQLPDQPLLYSRLEKTAVKLAQDDFEGRKMNYIWELDRMRRSRNLLVHNAEIPTAMPLITRQLYHYSKKYITSVIYELTNDHTGRTDLKTALWLW